ncbi:phage tail protein [Klebsiella michiganensis]|uniref:phage tail-collar fiber domain-containing protein n=1 Tax=Klebsiella michiganensis TaxID=1134687 RepID=UPI00253FF57A|nr:phage tail protein [Klebsiella michiganensis]MDK3052460.1 phage tail protein [Klebsiella michiganensis]
MSQTIVTNAFSPWLASHLAAGTPARPDKMIFAYINGQNAAAEIDPNEGMPSTEAIKYQAQITHYGVLSERAFVSSVILDTTIGDWDYNWIGLVDSATNTIVMIVHCEAQSKIKTAGGVQGNTLTRNLALEFSGAASAAQITVTPETWQIDYSARLQSMDEARRLACVDYYGPAAFDGGHYCRRCGDRQARTVPAAAHRAGAQRPGRLRQDRSR